MSSIGERLRARASRDAKTRRWLTLLTMTFVAAWCTRRWHVARGPEVGLRPGDVVSPDGAFAAFERHVRSGMSIDDDGLFIVSIARVGSYDEGEAVWAAFEWPEVAIRWIGRRTLEVAHSHDRDLQIRLPTGSIVVDGERVNVVRWATEYDLDDLQRITPLDPAE